VQAVVEVVQVDAVSLPIRQERKRARPLLLLVDDHDDNRALYADFLGSEGFQVAQAGSGSDAFAKALALRPDLILMDLLLPDTDGWEVTRRLRKDPRMRSIRIIAHTAHDLGGRLGEVQEAGFDGSLRKPCDLDDLVSGLWQMLERSRGEGTAVERDARYV
jgi:CheY-like chemotaxis protein